MNLQAKLIASALCLGALPLVQAADFEDFGKVTRVTPQVEQVNRPQQECRTEYVQVQQPAQERSAGGAIIGGIAGALLGNQPGGVSQQAVKQCRTVDHWESRNVGYQVSYDYRGRNYTSNMSYDPGERVRLRVSVEPAAQ